MDSLKQASYVREFDPDAKAHILYRDMRTPGLYENFYRQRQDDPGVFLTRGDVSEVCENNDGSLSIALENTLFGEPLQLKADLVVLALGQVPSIPSGTGSAGTEIRLSGFTFHLFSI
jgi:quinone-modifying oxidoreductase subunit QmoB